MAARESVKTKLNRLRWHSKQGEPVPVNASALLRCLEGDVKIEKCEMVDINTI